MGYQDSIDSKFNQKGIWVIEDKHLLEILKDDVYNPIINALRKRPMTIKELTENYNEIVKERALKIGIPKAEFERMKRSEKSIYRYVKDLIEANLLTVAGRRVVIDRTASENLYGRTAKVFLMKHEGDDYWDKEEAQVFLEKIAKILSLVLDKPVPSTKCLAEALNDMDSNKLRDVYVGLEEKYDEVSEILLEGTIKESNKVLDIVSMLIRIWNSEDYLKKLKKCFGE